jgi:hypothetical protein
MSAVGSGGCGFRHSLESARVALAGGVPENAGFLRDDAALAVVFVSDSDDCSAPPESPLFDKNLSSTYGFESTFRCRRFGDACGDPPTPLAYDSSHGPLHGCRPAPQHGGLLFDTARYTAWLTQPAMAGGLKADPEDVILYAIDGDVEPFEVVLSNPGTPRGLPLPVCGSLNEQSNPPCTPVIQYSCWGASPAFNATPSVRLEAVVQSVAHHGRHSWCDAADDFAGAFDDIARLIQTRFSEGCLTAGFATDDGHGALRADCTVIQGSPGQLTSVPACDGRVALPCWRVAADSICATSPLSARLIVDRGGDPPDVTRASCRSVGP